MRKVYRRRLAIYMLMILPALFVYVFAELLPIGSTLGYSFLKWNLMSGKKSFNGIDNFIKLFKDTAFWTALLFNLEVGFWTILGSNIFGFLIAYFLNNKVFCKGVIRSMFFIPNVVSTVLIAFAWVFIFSRMMPSLGAAIGSSWLENLSWFGTKGMATLTIVIVSIWQSIGFLMLIYTAGLQTVPTELLEAADLDGCSEWKKIVKIELPLLMPSITINLFVSIASAFKSYDISNAMTGGGPAGTTMPVSMNIYQEAFVKYNLGYGSAKSLILFLIVAVITIIQLNLTRKREVEY